MSVFGMVLVVLGYSCPGTVQHSVMADLHVYLCLSLLFRSAAVIVAAQAKNDIIRKLTGL